MRRQDATRGPNDRASRGLLAWWKRRRSSPGGDAARERGDGGGWQEDRGSALVVAVLVSVIMALLGISFLLTGETESLISRNEKLAAQALYVAESGARVVKQWFDDPAQALSLPDDSEVDRTLRRIVFETDPTTSIQANGVVGSLPYYKQGVDLDGDGNDDLFDRPYRGSLLNALRGTEEGPDLRIDDAAPGPARDFLDALSDTLLADFPWEGGMRRARISRIDVFAPPYQDVGGAWHRYGVASVKVIARIYQGTPADPRAKVVAEREIQAVLSEAPYYGPYGPLHSCGDLSFRRDGAPIGVHWGAMTAVGGTKLSGPPFVDVPRSLPRYFPGTPHLDLLWNYSDASAIADFLGEYGESPASTVDDPWFRSLSGGRLDGADPGSQPYPSDFSDCCDRSHLAQDDPMIGCPLYDYEVWKTLAGAGERGTHYFRWNGSAFQENGTGPEASFEELTDGAEGIYFFDTADGAAPFDSAGDGEFDNLTPPITITDTGWFFRGFLYLNARSFQLDVDPAATRAVTFNAPGEPFQDRDQNGSHDPSEAVVYLDYPTTLSGAIRLRDPSPAPARRQRGPDVAANASFEGILYTTGRFEATGGGNIYGSVIAREGVTQENDDGSAPTPDLYWDQSIVTDWPPAGWKVPRTTVTRWITDR